MQRAKTSHSNLEEEVKKLENCTQSPRLTQKLIINCVVVCMTNRPMKQNSPETNPHIAVTWFASKMTTQRSGGKDDLLNKWC